MLIRFSVKNFMSFDKMESFSMSASKVVRMKDHVISVGDKRILKGGFIFGANAGGKSNLVKAIDFAKKIVLSGSENVDFNKKHFRINKNNFNEPGIFQFDIMVNETAYSYGFAISYIDKKIVSEWLYRLGNSEVCIFDRMTEEDGTVQIKTDMKIKNKDNTKFKVYIDDYTMSDNKNMKQSLFLTDIANRSSGKSEFFKIFIDVYHWFENMIVIFPNSVYAGLGNIVKNQSVKEIFETMLRHFDTGVEEISSKTVDFDRIFNDIDSAELEQFKAEISNEFGNENAITVNLNNSILTLERNESGDIKARKMVLNHGNDYDLFDCTEESDGTQRLFDLIPIFFHKNMSKVIIIDEIDRSLHSELTKEFVRMFYQLTENRQMQIIATTHESSLMDLDFLRQDEIWFIERQSDHSSKIYSLNKFKERFDKKVEKDYLLGRYGAVPVFFQEDKFDEGGESVLYDK